MTPHLLRPCLLERPLHEIKAFRGWLGDQGWGECSASQSVGVMLLGQSHPSNTIMLCPPTSCLPTPLHVPRSHLTGLIPDSYGPSSLAHLTGSRVGETMAWPPNCPTPSLLPASISWGRAGHKGRIFPPAPSSSLWPPSLPPSLGWQRPKKTERFPSSLTLSPSLPALGRWFTPSSRPGSGPGHSIKFLQSFQN